MITGIMVLNYLVSINYYHGKSEKHWNLSKKNIGFIIYGNNKFIIFLLKVFKN